ncbi:MAG: DNA mismatch repair endonuclease MutL [Lachnospiraceae bacterium]|nr:DNA mismatch repair endonuclease MutL [Lachnospiraceae bacterium]
MGKIVLLDQSTIDKIAAGEVVERPSAVVKELVENAMDAGANAITVEIKGGGIDFIRITDNGGGIPAEDIPAAFKRHATSKIRSVEDLLTVSSLGFRGEALASISAVSQVELITKTRDSLMGNCYVIEGSKEKSMEEIGCPEGTTFVVRNLFYNTPARKKFLKSAQTEAGYIGDLVERLAISHPNISFKFLNNNQLRLHTSGNGNLKDIIYHIYGRDIARELLEINTQKGNLVIRGFIAKPIVSRGNRNYMNYFMNGRYIKSKIIGKAIEEAYKPYTMQHRYPMTALYFELDSNLLDVNVHPTKMEIRFADNQEIYQYILDAVSEALAGKEMIPEVTLVKEEEKKEKREEKKISAPEPFEEKRIEKEKKEAEQKEKQREVAADVLREQNSYMSPNSAVPEPTPVTVVENIAEPIIKKENIQQVSVFSEKLLDKEAKKQHRIIGQVFGTYWMVEYQDKLFMIDQHAAHEKVLFEQTMKNIEEKQFTSQMLSPPIILTLNMKEQEALERYLPELTKIGFEIESFGGREYSVRAVPGNLFGIASMDFLMELIGSLLEEVHLKSSEVVLEKVASMSCKAAVKGNTKLSYVEAEALIDELMELENPYHCPHGRPVIVSMSKYELEKKFKRIIG